MPCVDHDGLKAQCVYSGAGTNLKVWGEAHVRRKAPEIFLSCPPLFGSTSTISRFGERFRQYSVQCGQFLVCCSSAHGPPRAQPFVKVGEHVSPCPGVRATACIV